MRQVRGVALGTYYAKGAVAGRETPSASAMRGLVYAVKDNREPPNPPQLIAHPSHPSSRAIAVDRTNALAYVTAILARKVNWLVKFFGADDPRAVTLVPVPSSTVTASTIETTRFPTLRLCRALAGVGLGTTVVAAVQRVPVPAKTQGARRSADEILAGFVRTPVPIPRSSVIVLVDDNVQSGNSLAALDRLLGASRPTSAFAVAVTDARPCKHALKGRSFTIAYDASARSLDVIRTLGAAR
ncbi:MAG TPA: hypothetical protein VFP84_08870 [Kofleriaceae bacterium]|nr:hypothetical protein [Kofleriaceae bacterium]